MPTTDNYERLTGGGPKPFSPQDKADDRYSGRVSVTKFASVIPSFKSFTPVRCYLLQYGVIYSSTVLFDRWRRRDLEPELCPAACKSVPCRAKLGDVE